MWRLSRRPSPWSCPPLPGASTTGCIFTVRRVRAYWPRFARPRPCASQSPWSRWPRVRAGGVATLYALPLGGAIWTRRDSRPAARQGLSVARAGRRALPGKAVACETTCRRRACCNSGGAHAHRRRRRQGGGAKHDTRGRAVACLVRDRPGPPPRCRAGAGSIGFDKRSLIPH